MDWRLKEALESLSPTLAPDAMRQDFGEEGTRQVFLGKVGLEQTLGGFLKRKRGRPGQGNSRNKGREVRLAKRKKRRLPSGPSAPHLFAGALLSRGGTALRWRATLLGASGLREGASCLKP